MKRDGWKFRVEKVIKGYRVCNDRIWIHPVIKTKKQAQEKAHTMNIEAGI